MKYGQRPLQNKNDLLLISLLARQHPEKNLHVTDLPYRLCSWALDDPQNACLWFDHGKMVGWAVLQRPFWEIDHIFHPDYEASLFPELLAWADRRARAVLNTDYALPSWYISLFSTRTERINDVQAAGYQYQGDLGEDSWSKVLMQRPASLPVKRYAPPEGYVIRPLAGADEVVAYVELHRSAFGTKNMTEPWRQRTLEHPAYIPELDIVVTSPDGHFGAFCVCWYDSTSREGRIEPLACHADFRRYALGRVALAEGLYRLQQMGAETIVVETDDFRNTAFRLYESFGFEVSHRVSVFKKDFKA